MEKIKKATNQAIKPKKKKIPNDSQLLPKKNLQNG